MNAKFDVLLMVKVAQMYYQDGLKQEEIAKKMQISRSLISMILTEAKEVGIVEIKIRDPLMNNDELSTQFEKIFGLKKCSIVPTAVQNTENLRKLITQRAIDVFHQEVESDMNIGLAWGRTCYEWVTNYRMTTDKNLKNLNLVPLIGGSNQSANYFQLNEMIRVFAEKIGGEPNFIHAPAINANADEKQFYQNSSSMSPIRDKWAKMDIIISGVGILPDSLQSDRETYMGETEIFQLLAKEEAVGDICARYFNIHGEFIHNEVYDRILGIPVEDLRTAKNLICIASGAEKIHAILGALRTGLIHTFITDEQTAKSVLKTNMQ